MTIVFIDHYKILSIDRNVEPAAIKKAFRRLALKFHPDVCKLYDAQKRFIEVQEAYEILSDISKRHYYNILYDSYYQPKEKTHAEKKYEADVENDYQKWREAANKSALNLAREKYETAKLKIVAVIGETATLLTYITTVFIILMPFIMVYTSYSSIKTWDTDKDGNAIAGFVICSIISLFILFCGVLYIRNKVRE